MLKKWIFVLGYTILIYATLPYVPKLWHWAEGKVGDFLGLAVNISGIIFMVIWLSCLIKQDRIKKIYFSQKIILLLSGFLYIVLFSNLKLLIERVHLIEYGFLSYLIWLALDNKNLKFKRFFLALSVSFLIGLIDELIQRVTPGRVGDIRDVAVNWLSSFIGLIWVMVIKG